MATGGAPSRDNSGSGLGAGDGPGAFSCPVENCDKTFRSGALLVKHCNIFHINVDENGKPLKWIKCSHPNCPHTTYEKSNMDVHMIKHRAYTERPFPCTIPGCKVICATQAKLNEHLVCHRKGTNKPPRGQNNPETVQERMAKKIAEKEAKKTPSSGHDTSLSTGTANVSVPPSSSLPSGSGLAIKKTYLKSPTTGQSAGRTAVKSSSKVVPTQIPRLLSKSAATQPVAPTPPVREQTAPSPTGTSFSKSAKGASDSSSSSPKGLSSTKISSKGGERSKDLTKTSANTQPGAKEKDAGSTKIVSAPKPPTATLSKPPSTSKSTSESPVAASPLNALFAKMRAEQAKKAPEKKLSTPFLKPQVQKKLPKPTKSEKKTGVSGSATSQPKIDSVFDHISQSSRDIEPETEDPQVIILSESDDEETEEAENTTSENKETESDGVQVIPESPETAEIAPVRDNIEQQTSRQIIEERSEGSSHLAPEIHEMLTAGKATELAAREPDWTEEEELNIEKNETEEHLHETGSIISGSSSESEDDSQKESKTDKEIEQTPSSSDAGLSAPPSAESSSFVEHMQDPVSQEEGRDATTLLDLAEESDSEDASENLDPIKTPMKERATPKVTTAKSSSEGEDGSAGPSSASRRKSTRRGGTMEINLGAYPEQQRRPESFKQKLKREGGKFTKK